MVARGRSRSRLRRLDATDLVSFDLAGGARLLVDKADAEHAAAILAARPDTQRKEQRS